MRKSILAALAALLAACGSGKPAEPAQGGVDSLEIVDLRPGSGPSIAAGQTAVVNYTGWLYDAAAVLHKGSQFDSSLTTGAPFKFKVAGGEVIKGWDQGVLGMKVGGARRLTIPPALAYGDNGAGGVIPPGATLVFDVELLGIE
jgi:FKBP-type peptidyl-prolyl cis-trans isomerase FkpA